MPSATRLLGLKGGPGRPNIKPSGMEKATEPKAPPKAGDEPRKKGSKTSKLTIHEERTVKLKAPPQGSRFKGYTSYVVQDLTITASISCAPAMRIMSSDSMSIAKPAGMADTTFYDRTQAICRWFKSLNPYSADGRKRC